MIFMIRWMISHLLDNFLFPVGQVQVVTASGAQTCAACCENQTWKNKGPSAEHDNLINSVHTDCDLFAFRLNKGAQKIVCQHSGSRLWRYPFNIQKSTHSLTAVIVTLSI